MKKIITTVITAFTAVSLLTACGASSAAGTTASGAENAGSAANTEAGSENAGSTAGETKGELKKITFCLDWTPNTNHTGIYAAKALGYYEEAGLDVSIVQPPEDGSTQMCAAGQAQFAVQAQDTMAAALDLDEPLGITAVAAVLQHNTSCIMSRKEDNITSPKALEGKTYSTWESPVELAMLDYVMKEDGGDFSKVKQIPNDITDEPAGLAAHQTDALWVFYGWGGINADIEEVPVNTWMFSDISPELDYYTPVIIANDAFLQADPDAARAFMSATAKGYEYAAKNPEDAADILIAGDDTQSLTGSKDLVYASQDYISGQYIADADSWGIIDPERWDGFYGWLYENKLTAHDLRGKGYTNDYLKNTDGAAE